MAVVDTKPGAHLTVRPGVLACDRHGAVVAANERAAALLGLSEVDLVDEVRWHASDPAGAAAPPLALVVRQALRTGTRATRPVVVTAETHQRALLMTITPDADGAVVEFQPVQADLRESAGLLDPVTGLPNAVLLVDRLGHAVTRAHALGGMVSVVLADVCGLGRLTEALGEWQADALLAELGDRLRSGMRADHTVARYGGGTFAVVAEHARGTGAATADLVRRLAGDVAVRIGWATSDGRVPGHELLARAERALRP